MLKLILVLALTGSTFGYRSYGQQDMQAPPRAPPAPLPVATPPSYEKNPLIAPLNPCTVEIMRAMEIQLFSNPKNETEYIICTDVGIFTTMPCSPGTIFNKDLKHCVPVGWRGPLCQVGTCLNDADCFFNEHGYPKCSCRVGFTGEKCEVNIDECLLEGDSVCQKDGGVCIDQINAFYCVFDHGSQIGFSKQESMSTPCTLEHLSQGKQFFELPSPNKNVFVQCTAENLFVVSRCADMLFWHQELRTCSIERPVEKTGVCLQYPCKNDGQCCDLGGNNFECICKEGFTGALCDEAIDFCLNMPCGSGRCVSHTGGFNCVCQNNVVAQSCHMELRNPCTPECHTYHASESRQDQYFSCDFGMAFLRNCAPGLVWNQDLLTCIMTEQTRPLTIYPQRTMSQPTSSYHRSYKTPEIPRVTYKTAEMPRETQRRIGLPISARETYKTPEIPRETYKTAAMPRETYTTAEIPKKTVPKPPVTPLYSSDMPSAKVFKPSPYMPAPPRMPPVTSLYSSDMPSAKVFKPSPYMPSPPRMPQIPKY